MLKTILNVLNRISDYVLNLFIFSNFQREKSTFDNHTNSNVGDGFGLARSMHPTELIRIFIKCGLFRKETLFIDLGAGDGYVLRLVNIFFPKTHLLGIESDKNLISLVEQNVKNSILICSDLSDSELFLKLPEIESANVIAYIFNPCPVSLVIISLQNIVKKYGPILVIYKTYPAELESIFNFNLIEKRKNFLIFQLS